MTAPPASEPDRLSNRTLRLLPAPVARPDDGRAAVRPGIVHLGVGAFHKAHQAVYTDDCLRAGQRDWGIVGASLRSPGARDALAPQDGLYTVDARGDDARALRVVGAIGRVLHAATEGEALLATMADPGVRIVSLTVTEKGYTTDVRTGALNEGDADVRHDLAMAGLPRTALGYLAEALHRRRRAGVPPFTILSCDNLPANGRILKRALTAFATLREPDLGRHVADAVACPCTMVDRIVPATSEGDRASIQAALGLRDAASVVTETFSQWVIEDRFPTGRPEWEIGGAQIVADVEAHERMKLRLLNGAHTFLACAGMVLGLGEVAEAARDATLADALRRFWQEAGETLATGLDPHAYCARLEARFRNRALQHRLEQIARDTSLKIPQRILAPLLERRASGLPAPALLLALACWIRLTLGRAEDGSHHAIDDPAGAAWSRFDATPAASGALVRDRMAGLLERGPGAELLLDDLARLLREIMTDGLRPVLARAGGAAG